MKLEANRVQAFLADPGSVRVVLFHGDDASLVRDRASRLVANVAGSINDPFCVTNLERATVDALSAELASYSFGHRRVVRLIDAGEFAEKSLRRALATDGPGLAVLEAGALLPRDRLRNFIETTAGCVAVACHGPDAASIRSDLDAAFAAAGVTLDADAEAWLCNTVSGSHAMIARHVERLITYAGHQQCLSLEDVQACAAPAADATLDSGLFAAFAGRLDSADTRIGSSVEDGTGAIPLLRAALAHAQRLVVVRSRLQYGETISVRDAAYAARPPVPRKDIPDFDVATRVWADDALARSSQRLLQVERACKQTGAPGELLAFGALLGLAHQGFQRVRHGMSSRSSIGSVA